MFEIRLGELWVRDGVQEGLLASRFLVSSSRRTSCQLGVVRTPGYFYQGHPELARSLPGNAVALSWVETDTSNSESLSQARLLDSGGGFPKAGVPGVRLWREEPSLALAMSSIQCREEARKSKVQRSALRVHLDLAFTSSQPEQETEQQLLMWGSGNARK